LKKNLSCQCPCGYDFGTFSDKKTALFEIRLHFERAHKDFLPFGITDAEILSLIKQETAHKKQKVSLNNYC